MPACSKCNFLFGNTYTTANGGTANTDLGAYNYLLQMLWLRGANGMCTNSLTSANATCVDDVQNGSETDIDCGGSVCPACSMGSRCVASSDCASSWCDAGICAPANCTNGIKDGIETDVDCGELCPGCAAGRSCAFNSDCLTKICTSGSCIDHCHNGIKDVDESDVDCGGASCAGCADGMQCGTLFDCASKGCNRTTHVCVEHCSDGIRNYMESAVDCGGGCPGCGAGGICRGNSDCQSGMRCTGDECLPYCSDFQKDQNETDVDCGGGSCAACGAGRACLLASDCISGQCTNGACACATNADCPAGVSCSSGACSNHCSDGKKDYDETDVDCGGSCGECGPALRCKKPTDCTTGFCQHVCKCTNDASCPIGDVCLLGECLPHCQDYRKDADETDVDCGGASCPACGPGRACARPTDCTTDFCQHVCKCTNEASCPSGDACLLGECLPHCKDFRQDFDEAGVDCGGADCPLCPLCSSP